MDWINKVVEYWPSILLVLGAVIGFCAAFKKLTEETEWTWDDPIGSFVGKVGTFLKKLVGAVGKAISGFKAKE